MTVYDGCNQDRGGRAHWAHAFDVHTDSPLHMGSTQLQVSVVGLMFGCTETMPTVEMCVGDVLHCYEMICNAIAGTGDHNQQLALPYPPPPFPPSLNAIKIDGS